MKIKDICDLPEKKNCYVSHLPPQGIKGDNWWCRECERVTAFNDALSEISNLEVKLTIEEIIKKGEPKMSNKTELKTIVELQEYLSKNNLTKIELANQLGITTSQIHRWLKTNKISTAWQQILKFKRTRLFPLRGYQKRRR